MMEADLLKKLIDKALAAGKAFQSHQTGFVHYYHGMQEPAVHQTIPLYDNALFVLALFRSRLVEHMNEAKDLLHRLLDFQAGADGSFPFYLHEFPKEDLETGVCLLAPFYWILKQFGHVLGQDLKQKLENALALLIEGSISKEHPYSLSVRLSAALMACGHLFKRTEWIELGKTKWNALSRPHDSWHATAYLTDLFIALQMGGEEGPWQACWEFVNLTWDRETGCYIGPCIREWQEGQEPKPSAYDLFMGFFTGSLPSRTNSLGIYHLQAALIQPVLPPLSIPSESYRFSGRYQEQEWLLIKQKAHAYTLIEKLGHAGPIGEKTYTPFRLVWGNQQRTHTFVATGGKASSVEYKSEEDPSLIELFFDLDPESESHERDKQRDICFFWDDHESRRLSVEGQTATVFESGQSVFFPLDAHQTMSVKFELVEGEGRFLGHLAKGNRPSQLRLLKEEKHFQAYDGVLFIRALRRRTACRVKVCLKMHNRLNEQLAKAFE